MLPVLTWPMHLQLHTYLAHNVLGKPLVIEEFGLTWFKKTPAQQRVLFQVGGGRRPIWASKPYAYRLKCQFPEMHAYCCVELNRCRQTGLTRFPCRC